MRDQKIERRNGSRFILIREEYLQLFDYDRYTGVVLSALVGWHTHEINNLLKSKKKLSEPWVTLPVAEIRRSCLGLVGFRKIGEAIRRMQDEGLLSVRSSGGEASDYLLNQEELDRRIRALSEDEDVPDPDSVPARKRGWEAQASARNLGIDAEVVGDGTSALMPNTSALMPNTSALMPRSYKEDILTDSLTHISRDIGTPALSEELPSKNKPPETPKLPCPDLDIQPDVYTLDFIKNAYRIHNRRAKLDNLTARTNHQLGEKACQVEAEIGMKEFRTKLIGYLSDQSDFLVEKKWPLRVFLNQATNGASTAWLKSTGQQASTDTKALTPGAPAAVVDSRPVAPIDSRASWSEIIATWNSLVPSRPVDWDEKHDPTARLKALANDPKFVECWPGVCEKSQRIVEAQGDEGTWMHIRWVLGKNKISGVENWWRVESGELNSMMNPRRVREKTPSDVIAEAKANIRKKIEEEQHARDAREHQLGV